MHSSSTASLFDATAHARSSEHLWRRQASQLSAAPALPHDDASAPARGARAASGVSPLGVLPGPASAVLRPVSDPSTPASFGSRMPHPPIPRTSRHAAVTDSVARRDTTLPDRRRLCPCTMHSRVAYSPTVFDASHESRVRQDVSASDRERSKHREETGLAVHRDDRSVPPLVRPPDQGADHPHGQPDLVPELRIPRSITLSWIRRCIGEVVALDEGMEVEAALPARARTRRQRWKLTASWRHPRGHGIRAKEAEGASGWG
jgi:hypothetical protein